MGPEEGFLVLADEIIKQHPNIAPHVSRIDLAYTIQYYVEKREQDEREGRG